MTSYIKFPSAFDGDKIKFLDFRSELLTYAVGCSTAGDYQQGMLCILYPNTIFHTLPFQYHGSAIPGTPEIIGTPEVLAVPARLAVAAIEPAMGVAAVTGSLAVPAVLHVAALPTVPATPAKLAGPVSFIALTSPTPLKVLAANADALQLSKHAHAWNQFKYLEENYTRQ